MHFSIRENGYLDVQTIENTGHHIFDDLAIELNKVIINRPQSIDLGWNFFIGLKQNLSMRYRNLLLHNNLYNIIRYMDKVVLH